MNEVTTKQTGMKWFQSTLFTSCKLQGELKQGQIEEKQHAPKLHCPMSPIRNYRDLNNSAGHPCSHRHRQPGVRITSDWIISWMKSETCSLHVKMLYLSGIHQDSYEKASNQRVMNKPISY